MPRQRPQLAAALDGPAERDQQNLGSTAPRTYAHVIARIPVHADRGGYCTTECLDEGSESQCPLDTVCKPIQGGARRCLLICGSDSACDFSDCGTNYCPSGSSCVSVDNTTHQACEPEPG